VSNLEACQVYIEQQTQEGMKQGKTPYQIGREIAKEIDSLFETTVKPTTIEKRAERQREKNPTNVGKNDGTNSEEDPLIMCQECGDKEVVEGWVKDPNGRRQKIWGAKIFEGKHLCWTCRDKWHAQIVSEWKSREEERYAKWDEENPVNKRAACYWEIEAEHILHIINEAPVGRVGEDVVSALDNVTDQLNEKHDELSKISSFPST
jgi:hypothetical protein